MDAFFASVEQRDEPAYRGKPIAVGSSPELRGVVATASYEARAYGIHSAMPSKIALQKCQNLIFVQPRFEVYKQISEEIREIFYSYTDLVEPLSLDEAYLDVTENKTNNLSATLLAKEIKEKIFEKTKLTASAGISTNKFLAKVASGINKPDGLTLIKPENVETFIEKLSIEKFYGIGKVTAEKMHRLGIYNGTDLKKWQESDLIKHFGKLGSFYYKIARGIDERPVETNRIQKSIGVEESFAIDKVSRKDILEALADLAIQLEKRLLRHNSKGRTLTLKVKYANYQQVTRSKTLLKPLFNQVEINEIANELIETTEVFEKQARLLGLAISNLDNDLEQNNLKENNSSNLRWIQLKINFDTIYTQFSS